MDFSSQEHSYKLADSSQDHEELPQEWPDHLHAKATVKPVERVFYRGEFLLDFARMPAATFEQFCWSLLTKEQSLHGCQRLGKNGAEQGGIDLFAYDERFIDKLNVYECKAWKKFDSKRLTEAIDRFLHGQWKKDARSFTLILAQEDLGEPLARRWDIERKRLRQSGIEGELWTAHHLTQKIQSYPDLLQSFFQGRTSRRLAICGWNVAGFSMLSQKQSSIPGSESHRRRESSLKNRVGYSTAFRLAVTYRLDRH